MEEREKIVREAKWSLIENLVASTSTSSAKRAEEIIMSTLKFGDNVITTAMEMIAKVSDTPIIYLDKINFSNCNGSEFITAVKDARGEVMMIIPDDGYYGLVIHNKCKNTIHIILWQTFKEVKM